MNHQHHHYHPAMTTDQPAPQQPLSSLQQLVEQPLHGGGVQLAPIDVAGPPEKIASDYVELASLLLMFAVGAPLNLAAFTQLAERPIYSRLDMLKRHLNYSDLLVMFIYVPSRACWLATYDWRGGDFLCRLIKAMHTFAFQVSSNVIVVIAVDRLLTVVSAAHRQPAVANRRMHLMLGVAWFSSLAIACPQFIVWRTYVAFREPVPWSQCLQIWEIARAELKRQVLSLGLDAAAATANGTTTTTSPVLVALSATADRLLHEENIYTLVHILLIFWIPSIVVVLCYAIVSCWVWANSTPHQQPDQRGGDHHHVREHEREQQQHLFSTTTTLGATTSVAAGGGGGSSSNSSRWVLTTTAAANETANDANDISEKRATFPPLENGMNGGNTTTTIAPPLPSPIVRGTAAAVAESKRRQRRRPKNATVVVVPRLRLGTVSYMEEEEEVEDADDDGNLVVGVGVVEEGTTATDNSDDPSSSTTTTVAVAVDETTSLTTGGSALAVPLIGGRKPPPTIVVNGNALLVATSSTANGTTKTGTAVAAVASNGALKGGGVKRQPPSPQNRAPPSPAIRTSQSSTCSGKANRRKAIRVSCLLVCGYLACWLPYNTLSLIQFIDRETFSSHVNKLYCVHGFIVFNSVINPFLYGIFGGRLGALFLPAWLARRVAGWFGGGGSRCGRHS